VAEDKKHISAEDDLGEVIVFILFVHFPETATKTGYANLTPESLILPAAIFLLSLSLMVLRQGE